MKVLILIIFSLLSLFINSDAPCNTPVECYLKAYEQVSLLKTEFRSRIISLEDKERELETKNKNLEIVLNQTQKELEDSNSKHKKELDEMPLKIFNLMHPINSVYYIADLQYPPFHGSNGVVWELLPEGHVLMTGSSFVGSGGANRIDNGSTAQHILTINEMPSHVHAQGSGVEFALNGAYSATEWRNDSTRSNNPVIPYTFPAGGNQPHTHELNVLNYKLRVFVRKS